MSHKSCSQESAVAGAVRSGRWNEGLEAHLRQCAACRNVQEAARWMQSLASTSRSSATLQGDLPDPQILWLRAQLSERQAAVERAQGILQWLEVAWVTTACVGLGILLAWNWNAIVSEIRDMLGWIPFDAWPASWANLSSHVPANAPTLSSSVLIVISLLGLFVAYPLLSRE